MQSVFVFFDLGGTLVDLRGIVASMAARLSAIRVRGQVPLALLWASRTAEALPTAQGALFQSEREIASAVLRNLLEKRGRADGVSADRLVREAWARYVGASVLQPDVTVKWLLKLHSKVSGLGVGTGGGTEAGGGVLSPTGLNGLVGFLSDFVRFP